MSRTVRVYLSGNEVHDRVLRAFHEGCGASKTLVTDWHYEPSDIAVIFGVYKSRVPVSWPRGRIFSQQRNNNLDVIVLETGYINRGDGENHHYAAGFNGLNGRADFRAVGMPDDRARLLGTSLKPWRAKGNHVILCGQVPWDASVDHSDHLSWLSATSQELQKRTKRKVIFRPHPLVKHLDKIIESKWTTGPLADALEGAHAVVTFNSNAGVESTILGVPAICMDEGSMIWNIGSRTLNEIENPKMLDRAQWLNDLAYKQWTLDEMRAGLAWNHLFRG